MSRFSLTDANAFSVFMPMAICCCMACVSSSVFSPRHRLNTPRSPKKLRKYHDRDEM